MKRSFKIGVILVFFLGLVIFVIPVQAKTVRCYFPEKTVQTTEIQNAIIAIKQGMIRQYKQKGIDITDNSSQFSKEIFFKVETENYIITSGLMNRPPKKNSEYLKTTGEHSLNDFKLFSLVITFKETYGGVYPERVILDYNLFNNGSESLGFRSMRNFKGILVILPEDMLKIVSEISRSI